MTDQIPCSVYEFYSDERGRSWIALIDGDLVALEGWHYPYEKFATVRKLSEEESGKYIFIIANSPVCFSVMGVNSAVELAYREYRKRKDR